MAGSNETNEPRLLGSIFSEMLQSNSPFSNAFCERLKGLHPNSEVCVDLKLYTFEPGRIPLDSCVVGAIARDGDAHYTFTETLPWSSKRNPRLFNGKYISITQQDNGSLRPNFKPLKIDKDFTVDGYALGVCNELRMALNGLVKE